MRETEPPALAGVCREESPGRAFRWRRGRDPSRLVGIEVVAGPDAGWGVDVSPGRHLVGRARHCGVVIDDPAIEANHLVLDVDVDGRFDVVQLAGRVPIVVAEGHLAVGDSQIHLTTNCVSDPGLIARDRSHSVSGHGLELGVRVGTLLEPGDGEPVFLTSDSLVIVDDHPDLARAHAIVRSLDSQAAALRIAAPACLLTAPGDLVLDECEAILEIGARWRARLMRADESIRLHAAGRKNESPT